MIVDSPIAFRPTISLSSHKWNILKDLWSQTNNKSLTFTIEPEGWYIREFIDEVPIFQLRRDCVNFNRYTDLDTFGLLGLSLLNLNDKTCFITEGVSDYISAKLCLPNRNVLGVTNLGGSLNARKILVSLFDEVTICADKDKTGLTVAFFKWKTLFDRYGIKSKVWTTSSPTLKDFTDEFLFNLKLDPEDVQF